MNLKIDRRLVIDHKWQEIHLSSLISPFYLSVLPLWDFSHQIVIQPSHMLAFIPIYPVFLSLNRTRKSALPALYHVACYIVLGKIAVNKVYCPGLSGNTLGCSVFGRRMWDGWGRGVINMPLSWETWIFEPKLISDSSWNLSASKQSTQKS